MPSSAYFGKSPQCGSRFSDTQVMTLGFDEHAGSQ
jgi:hypothetical protein